MELEEGLTGKQEKNRRRTLRKQREKIRRVLQNLIYMQPDVTIDGSSEMDSCGGVTTSFSEDKSSELLKNPKAHVGKGFFWQS